MSYFKAKMCRILSCAKSVYHLKHVQKVLALAFRANRLSACLRRFSPGIKTLNSLKKTRYNAIICPHHGGTQRINSQ